MTESPTKCQTQQERKEKEKTFMRIYVPKTMLCLLYILTYSRSITLCWEHYYFHFTDNFPMPHRAKVQT